MVAAGHFKERRPHTVDGSEGAQTQHLQTWRIRRVAAAELQRFIVFVERNETGRAQFQYGQLVSNGNEPDDEKKEGEVEHLSGERSAPLEERPAFVAINEQRQEDAKCQATEEVRKAQQKTHREVGEKAIGAGHETFGDENAEITVDKCTEECVL